MRGWVWGSIGYGEREREGVGKMGERGDWSLWGEWCWRLGLGWERERRVMW